MLYFVFLVWFSYYFGCLFYVHKKQFQPYFNRMQNVVAAPPAGHSKVQKQHWPNIYIYIYKRYRLYCLYFFTCHIYLWIVYMLYLLICVTKLYIYSFSTKKKKLYIYCFESCRVFFYSKVNCNGFS